MAARLTAFLMVCCSVVVVGIAQQPAGATSTNHASPVVAGGPTDFNGDGFGDLAIGAPGETIQDLRFAGAVNVIYGSATGLTSSGNQVFVQGSNGVPGFPDFGADFGGALASSDFNGDGFADLAVGIPGLNPDFLTGRAGAVTVLYGSTTGLASNGILLLEGDSGIPDSPEESDSFGYSVAAGDMNGDGFADLAVGVPGETIEGADGAGGIVVLFGSADGLTGSGSELWSQASLDVRGASENGDEFGYSLAAGDFDGDGLADVAVGVPAEDAGSVEDAGAVNVLKGSAGGITAHGNQLWTQNSPGILGTSGRGDEFGLSVAAGDLNRDGSADLAVGTPFDDIGSRQDAGLVNVLYGSGAGLTSAGSQGWSQNSPGIAGAAELGDLFGAALAVGDFNGDGDKDLAVGAPSEAIGSVELAGVVNIILGTGSGLSSGGNQIWSQDSPGIAGSSERFDQFGSALSAGDFGNGAGDDLVAGTFREDLGGKADAGVVNVIYGQISGLSSIGNQLWSQDSPGILGTAEEFDAFGAVLPTE